MTETGRELKGALLSAGSGNLYLQPAVVTQLSPLRARTGEAGSPDFPVKAGGFTPSATGQSVLLLVGQGYRVIVDA